MQLTFAEYIGGPTLPTVTSSQSMHVLIAHVSVEP